MVVADVVVVVANAVETVNLVPSALYITKSELLGNILWAIRLMHIDISTRLRQGFLQKIRRHLSFFFENQAPSRASEKDKRWPQPIIVAMGSNKSDHP